MKAAVFERAGSPLELVRVIDMDVPVPRGRETLVKVDASPIQPADVMFIEGGYRIRPVFPQVAGSKGPAS